MTAETGNICLLYKHHNWLFVSRQVAQTTKSHRIVAIALIRLNIERSIVFEEAKCVLPTARSWRRKATSDGRLVSRMSVACTVTIARIAIAQSSSLTYSPKLKSEDLKCLKQAFN
ncbi:MAG: hypothetical protein KME42_02480 [Tildeniella nuda ZEHNDER 1965/U140]|jgi:predicted transposase YbfD/YdcC|nr:hypothetical protein [Tildeniella nuda ZEHNDER 1965/U140]